MKRKPIKSFKRFLAGTLAFVTAVSIVSGYPLSVSAEERVPTGTDLDNFDLSFNWGDKVDGLSDDYELVMKNNGTSNVKMQMTVEYRGDGTKAYQPEELKIEFNDFYNICSHDKSYTVDIAAELKGSNSGRGDWYYTKTFNESTGNYDYTLTNKNVIDGAFTSTIQVVFNLSNFREFHISEYTGSIVGKMSDTSNSFNSNVLNFNYKGVKDVYSMEVDSEKLPSNNNILNKIESTRWNDYYYANLVVNKNSNEVNTIGLSDYSFKTNLPDDIIQGDWVNNTSKSTLAVAIPREKYLVTDVLDVGVEWYGTYYGDDVESFIDTDNTLLSISYFSYDYIGNLYSHRQGNISYKIYNEIIQYDYAEKNTQSYFSRDLYVNNTDTENYNLILGIDKMYYMYTDNTFRELDDDEKWIKVVTTENIGTKWEIYGKKVGTDEYIKLKDNKSTLNYVGEQTVSAQWNDKSQYYDVYIKYYNINQRINRTASIFRSYIYDNAALDNGKEIKGVNVMSYMQIEKSTPDGTPYLVKMNYDISTNNNDLAEEIKACDDAEGNTKYRYSKYCETEHINIEPWTSLWLRDANESTNESVYLDSFDVSNSLSNDSLLGYQFDSFEQTYVYDKNLSIDKQKSFFAYYENFIGYNSQNMSQKTFEETSGCVVTYSEKIDGDKKVLTVKYDYSQSGGVTINKGYNRINFPSFQPIFTISLDDYIIKGLEGTSTSVDVSHIKIDMYAPQIDKMFNIDSLNTFKTLNLSYPSVAYSSYQNVDSLISTNSQPYTKNRSLASYGTDYKYKLRATAGATQMSNIVMYDNLETAKNSDWHGSFKGISFEMLEQSGEDTNKYKVYYSTSRDQICNLDADGWILSSEYTGELADINSIAIALDGFVLNTNSIMYVEILMSAPESTSVTNGIAHNSYNISYQEFDKDDINLTNPLNSVTNLYSNRTEAALGDVMTNLSIVKVWDDFNNKLQFRPNSITGKIYQNGVLYDTFELSEDNKWTETISVKMYEAGDTYEYSIEEDNVENYITTIEQGTDESYNFIYTITNTLSTNVYTEVSGTKLWDDNDNEYGIRPDSITVNLYQNGVKIDTATTDSSKDWKYTFGVLEKCDSEGNEYVYTVKEENVKGYIAEYPEKPNGVQVHFNSLFETESIDYDYVEIYYQLDGNIYNLGTWGDTELADKTVEIPSTDFYVYWSTDSSVNDYYGFAIDSVTGANVEIPSSQIPVSLPDTSSGVYEECTGTNYPESEHNPYLNSSSQGWHYTSNVSGYDIINHPVRYEDLHITKLIPLSDILAEHGAPSFIFKAEGSSGHTYYQTITFDENSDYGIYEENGIEYAILSTTFFDIEEDIYTVSEIGVSRFKLQEITDISENATVSEDTVIVDLTKGYGFATFVNAKTKWNNFSHKDIRVNEIHLEPKKPV